jgi:hypothetical protein
MASNRHSGAFGAKPLNGYASFFGLMVAGGVLVVVGFICSAFQKNIEAGRSSHPAPREGSQLGPPTTRGYRGRRHSSGPFRE